MSAAFYRISLTRFVRRLLQLRSHPKPNPANEARRLQHGESAALQRQMSRNVLLTLHMLYVNIALLVVGVGLLLWAVLR